MKTPTLLFHKTCDDILSSMLIGLLMTNPTGPSPMFSRYDSKKTYHKNNIVWEYDDTKKTITFYRCISSTAVTLNTQDWLMTSLMVPADQTFLVGYSKYDTTEAVQDFDTISDAIGKLEGSIDNHGASVSPHNATPEAVANRLILRDTAGRAKTATPSDPTDIANKQYVDLILAAAAAGLVPKEPVKVLLVSNTLPSYGSLPVIDDVQLVSGDRIFINGTDVTVNGVYTIASNGALTAVEKIKNTHYYVQEGTVYGTTEWVFLESGAGIKGSQWAGKGAVAGQGLGVNGRIWDVQVDGITLEIVNDKIQFKSTYQIPAATLNGYHVDDSQNADPDADVIWSALQCLETFVRKDNALFTGQVEFENKLFNARGNFFDATGRPYNSFYTTSNTSSEYQLSVIVPWDIPSTGLLTGDAFLVKFHTKNAANPTLKIIQKVNGVSIFTSTNIPLYAEGVQLPVDYIDTDKIYTVVFNTNRFEVSGGFGRIATDSTPGIMKMYSTDGNNEDGTISQKIITELITGRAATEHKHEIDDIIEADPRVGGLYAGSVVPTSTANRLNYDGEFAATRVRGGTYNDYAECRLSKKPIQPGRIVVEDPSNDDFVALSTDRLNPTASVCSDTYGFIIGSIETNDYNVPIGVAGRVLVYPYGDISKFTIGACVCSGPDGTVDVMTRTEVKANPECIIGTVSSIPSYETWGANNVFVNGRIWIKLR